MKWIYSIIPYKIISAACSLLIILLVIHLGGSALEVGIVTASLTLGTLLAAIFWTKLILKTRKKIRFIYFGYVAIALIVTSFYVTKNIFLIYLLAFLFNFLRDSIYYASLFLAAEEKKINKAIGNLETIGGYAWVAGLILGFFSTILFEIKTTFAVLTFISFLSIAIVTPFLSLKIIHSFIDSILIELGFITAEEKPHARLKKAFPKIYLSLRKIVTHFHTPAFFLHIFSVKQIKMHLATFILYFSFGLALPQVITLAKAHNFSDSSIFLLSLIGSLASALFYKKASEQKKKMFIPWILFRFLIFSFLAVLTIFSGLSLYAFLIFFFFLEGASMAFVRIIQDLMFLKFWKKEIGTNIFFRQAGTIFGNLISGMIVLNFGFFINFLLAGVIILNCSLLFRKLI